MATTFILGSHGSGKTALVSKLIADDLRNGREVILLVPEQQAVSAEHRVADAAGDTPTLGLEVLNFRRLANRVFRQYGGLSYNYIGRGAKSLIMWRALSSVSPALTEYRDITLSDSGLISRMLSTVNEFKSFLVKPSQLENAAKEMYAAGNASKSLIGRLNDLSLIYAAYDALTHSEYDDPDDDLTLLSEKLDEHDFFSGKRVYIDSFYGFTPQEYAVLRHIIRQSDETFITSPVTRDSESPHLDTPRYTLSRLRQIARDCRKTSPDITLDDAPRYSTAALRYLAENLWNYGCEPFGGETADGLSLVACGDIFEEAEYIAADIERRIREGARYRDFAVFAREMTRYSGVIDAVFEKHAIPYFMSTKTNLCDLPLYKLILSSLSIVSRAWQSGDVITYLKTGLCGFTPDECDVIEDYISTWNISGRRWTDDIDWTLNPDGYTAEYTERQIRKLSEVNRLRVLLREPLVVLSEAVSGRHTVREISASLYEFTLTLNIPERLTAQNDAEGIQIFSSFSDTLDQLVSAAGDMETNAEEYSRLFAMIASDADYGHIPQSLDEVTLGSAKSFRPDTKKHIYIVGANDGVFPQPQTDDKLLSDRDREILKGFGVTLEYGSDKRSSDELMYFTIAAATPSDSLTVTYATADLNGKSLAPSSAFERILSLFPTLDVVNASESELLRLPFSPTAGFEFLKPLGTSNAGRVLRSYYAELPDYGMKLSAFDTPITDTQASLSSETTSKLYQKHLRLSQSRLDSFALCNFAYNMKYTLGLKESRRAEFRSVDTGNFIHHVLENILGRIYGEKSGEIPTDAELEAVTDEVISSYSDRIFGSTPIGGRMRRTVSKLKKTSLLLVKNLITEFSQSDFVPVRFEMPVGFEGNGSIPPLRIPLGDGTSAYLCGIIDRTDVYRKGNDVYVRVVDYKTGAKDFSLSDIALGINLQLLLYLFTICHAEKPSTLTALGIDGTDSINILPAGALYLGARSPEISAEQSTPPEVIMSEVNDSIKRSGLLLGDDEILRAMEHNLEGKFIPVKVLKSGDGYRSGAPVVSLEDFDALYRRILGTVRELAVGIKSGKSDAAPLKTYLHDACKYCPMKPVCRFDAVSEVEEESDG